MAGVRDQLTPTLSTAPVVVPPAQWRPVSAPQRPSPRSFHSTTPLLPRISSLLTPVSDFPPLRGIPQPRSESCSGKRPRSIDDDLSPPPLQQMPNWARPRGCITQETGVAPMRRVVYPKFVFERDTIPVPNGPTSPVKIHRQLATERILTSDEVVQRRRLFYISPDREIRIPTEIPVIPRFQSGDRRHKQLGHVQMEPIYGRSRMEERPQLAQKRRRTDRPPSPPPLRSRSFYPPECELTALERSCLSMSSASTPSATDEEESRRHYDYSTPQSRETIESPRCSEPCISYNDRGGLPTAPTSALPATIRTPSPRMQTFGRVGKPDSSMAAMVLKSKEFLQSKILVRNRHDEIDWVATFLNVGFDSTSIYALMCPLRKGRWKAEEEKYTLGLLRLIKNGTILLRHGQSIRGYIGEKLHSDDMRVLKKLSNCKMFHFAKLINPRLAEEEKLDMAVESAKEELDKLEKLKGEFLRSVQLEALVAVRKYLSDSSLRDLLNVRD